MLIRPTFAIRSRTECRQFVADPTGRSAHRAVQCADPAGGILFYHESEFEVIRRTHFGGIYHPTRPVFLTACIGRSSTSSSRLHGARVIVPPSRAATAEGGVWGSTLRPLENFVGRQNNGLTTDFGACLRLWDVKPATSPQCHARKAPADAGGPWWDD